MRNTNFAAIREDIRRTTGYKLVKAASKGYTLHNSDGVFDVQPTLTLALLAALARHAAYDDKHTNPTERAANRGALLAKWLAVGVDNESPNP